MVAQPGKNILVAVGDGGGPEAFTTMAGGRTKSISMNGELIDITNSDSVNMHREGLAATGSRGIEIEFQGVFTDAVSHDTARVDFLAQTIRNYEITIPDFQVITMGCKITSLNYEGDYNNEISFSMTLTSSGEPAFANV